MLVIARKVGQTVLIGDNIEISISAIRGDQVRLAIKAPREITILRQEVLKHVETGNAEAVSSAPAVMEAVSREPAPETQEPLRAPNANITH